MAQKAALFVLVSWTGFSWWAGWPVQGFGPSLALGAGAALVFLVGGRAFNSRGRLVMGRTLPLGFVVITAGAVLALAACLDIASPPFESRQIPEQSERRPFEVTAWTAETMTANMGSYYSEEDVRRMGIDRANLLLWRHFLRQAERDLEEVRARYPDDARRIKDAELGVRNSRGFVDMWTEVCEAAPRRCRRGIRPEPAEVPAS
ncbi:MAG: hypothetical protein OXQ94_09490 [Gemmatimonadota bacterium]|nr:hypothetical protein [Gemmatimonadota bacterium]